jgi:hypothetical protein
MRHVITVLMISITLCSATASAAPIDNAPLQSLIELRAEHDERTLTADKMLKDGYFQSASVRYRKLERAVEAELFQLHALNRMTASPEMKHDIDAQIRLALENLESVAESKQLIYVALRTL